MIAYSWEWVLSHESINKVYDKAGNCLRPEASVDAAALAAKTKKLAVRGPTRLEWLLHAQAREAIKEAVAHAQALCQDIDLVVDCFATKTGGCALSIQSLSKLRSADMECSSTFDHCSRSACPRALPSLLSLFCHFG